MQFPQELFYTIFAHVDSRSELIKLATTSRVLQGPAEAALHSEIIIQSRIAGRRLLKAINNCSRFAPLVRTLRFELDLFVGLDWGACTQEDAYWKDVSFILSKLSGLQHLMIHDGLDGCFSWALNALRPGQLRTLHCSFVMDVQLIRALNAQHNLQDLSLTGSLIHLPRKGKSFDPLAATTDISTSPSDPDVNVLLSVQAILDDTALPNLKYLHTESLAVARTLVPGRPVSHLWVPGASFSTAVASDYIYRHIHGYGSQVERNANSTMHPGFSEREDATNGTRGSDEVDLEGGTVTVQQVGPQSDLSAAEHVSYLCSALSDFSRTTSKEGIVSLRMALNLPNEDGDDFNQSVRDVLACVAKTMPDVRALGFLPTSILEPKAQARDEKVRRFSRKC
jgi:hypothetical protein